MIKPGETSSPEFQESISKNPGLLLKISPLRDAVQMEIDQINKQMFSNEAFKREEKLRSYFRKLLDDKTFNITDIEDLSLYVKELKEKYNLKPGQSLYFAFRNKSLMITSTGHIMPVHKHVDHLEKELIKVYNLNSWDYIKLAFKKLWRSNG